MIFFSRLNVKLCLLILCSLLFNNLSAQIPVISSFSPVSGPAGTTVTISGSNFSAIPLNNFVYFGGIQATVITASATTLSVKVPYGAKYAPVSVTANNRTGYSSTFYSLTFAGGAAAINTNSLLLRKDYSP